MCPEKESVGDGARRILYAKSPQKSQVETGLIPFAETVTYSQPFKKESISEEVRIGSVIIFHLSKQYDEQSSPFNKIYVRTARSVIRYVPSSSGSTNID